MFTGGNLQKLCKSKDKISHMDYILLNLGNEDLLWKNRNLLRRVFTVSSVCILSAFSVCGAAYHELLV